MSDKQSEVYDQKMILLAKEYAETDPEYSLKLSYKTLSRLKNDSLSGQLFVALSSAHSYMASYDSSTAYCFRALKVAEYYHDTVTLIDAYNNIGIDFMFQEEDAKAIEYFKKVESFSKSFGDSLRLGHALTNLGIMKSYEGNSMEELSYYQRALEIFKSINEQEGLANATLNIGTVYTVLEDYERADEYYNEALKLFREINYSSGIQNTLQSAAENALKNQDLKKANALAQQSLQIAIENSLGQDIVYTYELLSEIAKQAGNNKFAYDYYKLRTEKKEELFTEEKARQVLALETEYNTIKKEAEIARLSLENKLQTANLARSRDAQIGIVTSAVLLLSFVMVFYKIRQKKQQAENEAQELQIEALKKRLTDLNINHEEMNLDLEGLNSRINSPLTEREFEALQLSLTGKTNHQIGEELYISTSTVKFHLRNTYGKLGVANRKEARAYVNQSS